MIQKCWTWGSCQRGSSIQGVSGILNILCMIISSIFLTNHRVGLESRYWPYTRCHRQILNTQSWLNNLLVSVESQEEVYHPCGIWTAVLMASKWYWGIETDHHAQKNKRVVSSTFHYHHVGVEPCNWPPPARNSNILRTEIKTLLQDCCHKELEMIENAQKNDLKVLEMGSRIRGVSRVHTFGVQK